MCIRDSANLPYSLFEFIKLGKEGQIRNFGTSTDSYLEAAFSYSFPLMDDRLDVYKRQRPAATNEPGITVRMSDHAEAGNFDFLIGPAGDVEFPNAHAVGIDQPGIVLNDMLLSLIHI